MAKLSLIKTDSKREVEGVWVEWEMGVELKIARAGNRAFDDLMQKTSEPFLKKTRKGELPEGKAEEILKHCVASTILLGWKNIEDDDGKTLKYSAKKAKELLDDEDLRDLYKFILVQSNETARYRRELDEDGAKN